MYALMLLIPLLLITTLGGNTAAYPQDEPSDPQTNIVLSEGRYVGHLKLDQRNERIALTADFYIESPDDYREFPTLNAILKLGLGGNNTHEYVAQTYKALRYDFDNHVLSMDEPSNDLVISAKLLAREGRPHLEGTAWIRSSGKRGSISLTLETDEPPDLLGGTSSRMTAESPTFVPLLTGEYIGACNGRESVFQIQTVKGLLKEDASTGKPFFDYEIIARLGHRSSFDPNTAIRPWAVYGTFAGGSYDIFTGRLVFLGPSTTAIECKVREQTLHCRYRVQGGSQTCEFHKRPSFPSPPVIHERQYHLNPSTDQLRELPNPSPPDNSSLASAVSGEFLGYLHHEALDRYQPIRLRVVASSSTENPHNSNKLLISATASLHFGSFTSEDSLPYRYEPRAFYLRPGFMLHAPGTDSFIRIDEWKLGYVRGTWYSHAFGKVGSVELVKEALPELPPEAARIHSWTGESEGNKRWFQLILPNQSAERRDSTIPFVGSYQTIVGSTAIEPMNKGRFDPYTGALGWVFSANGGISVVSGNLASDGTLFLLWPPIPHTFNVLMSDFGFEPFHKLEDP